MNRNDVTLFDTPYSSTASWTLGVAAGTPPTVKAGEMTRVGTAPNVIIMLDGEGTTTERFTGVAVRDSNEVAATAGDVELWKPLPGIVYAAVALTATAADTLAEIVALKMKRVVIDVTSGKFTVDTAAADSATNTILIVGGDPNTSTIYFDYMLDGSALLV